MYSRDIGRKLRQRKSKVDDGLTVSEKRDFTNWGGYWNADTDVHFFNMNKEVFKHERFDDILHITQSSENTQERVNPKEQRCREISRVLVFGHHSR